MRRIQTLWLGAAAMAVGTVAFGQDNFDQQSAPPPVQNTAPGWHRFGERIQTDQDAGGPQQQQQQQAPPQAPQQYPVQQQYAMPTSLLVPAGTWITIRMDQGLSSDRNQQGDAFTASLAEPIIAQGLVVARRGQTIAGRVTQASKAGRVKGTSEIGIELTELSLADGQQMPVKTQFIARRGDTSVGSDVGAVGLTAGLGALIGAAAGGGWGAGIGALAGAAVGTTGVLATRGHQTIIYPESVLTFRLEQPLTITSQAMQAFQPAGDESYGRPMMRTSAPPPQQYRAPYPVAAYPYYPSYYPSVGVYFRSSPGFFYGRGYYGRHRW